MSEQDETINKFWHAVPILNVHDVTKSIDYYVNALGFNKDFAWDDPPTFARVSRNDVKIFLCQGAQGQAGTWMQIFIDDVDALYKEYQASGANIRQAPTNFDWGIREMNVEDLDGHRLRISSSTEAASDGVPLCEDK